MAHLDYIVSSAQRFVNGEDLTQRIFYLTGSRYNKKFNAWFLACLPTKIYNKDPFKFGILHNIFIIKEKIDVLKYKN